MPKKKSLRFQPIAVVGRGCVLPGASNVEELWKVLSDQQVEISSGSEDNWRVDQDRLTSYNDGEFTPDKMWSTQGGYVRGFDDSFDSNQFELSADLLQNLDPVFLWSLEAARQAKAEVTTKFSAARSGVVLGNLSYPTRAQSQFAEEVWLKEMFGSGSIETSSENRFMSGLPAMIVARGL
ncbi:MAG: hypothetical protein HOE54_02450, partial [Gammaproteobacteria bacterium]|nr:hypothetical protein [Gammaproteobacteria bacterium]